MRLVQGRVEEHHSRGGPERVGSCGSTRLVPVSTYHELCSLFPRLSPEGVLIVDDYGRWDGARQAINEFFEETGERILLNRPSTRRDESGSALRSCCPGRDLGARPRRVAAAPQAGGAVAAGPELPASAGRLSRGDP